MTLDTNIQEIMKKMEIEHKLIGNDNFKKNQYEQKKTILLNGFKRKLNELENQKPQIEKAICNLEQLNTKIENEKKNKKLIKINNMISVKKICKTDFLKKNNIEQSNLKYNLETIRFIISPPNKWLINYDIKKIKFDFKNGYCEYEIKLCSIPEIHFNKIKYGILSFDLYVEYEIPKIITISYLNDNTNKGMVISSKCITKNVN
jgi:hypothetical protein